MAERRSLVAGVEVAPHGVDPELMRAFISQEKPGTAAAPRPPVALVPAPQPAGEEGESPSEPPITAESSRPEPGTQRRPAKPGPQKRARPVPLHSTPLVPVMVRLKPEIADALKRASLERQLHGFETYTQQDIVEDALVPWLKAEGLLE